MNRSMTRTAVAGAVLVLGSLAGCAGEDAASDEAESAAEASGADTGDTGNTDSGDTDTGDTGDDTTGESGGGDYCAALEDAKAELDAVSGGDAGAIKGFADAFDTMRNVGEQAPDEVSAEWETVVAGIDQVEQAVEDAGLTMDDLAAVAESPDPENLPDGVTIESLQQLGTEMQQLNSPELTAAQGAIDAHAQEECDITLDQAPEEAPVE